MASGRKTDSKLEQTPAPHPPRLAVCGRRSRPVVERADRTRSQYQRAAPQRGNASRCTTCNLWCRLFPHGRTWRAEAAAAARRAPKRGEGAALGAHGRGATGRCSGDDTPQPHFGIMPVGGKTAVASQCGRRPPQILAVRGSPSRWRGRPRISREEEMEEDSTHRTAE